MEAQCVVDTLQPFLQRSVVLGATRVAAADPMRLPLLCHSDTRLVIIRLVVYLLKFCLALRYYCPFSKRGGERAGDCNADTIEKCKWKQIEQLSKWHINFGRVCSDLQSKLYKISRCGVSHPCCILTFALSRCVVFFVCVLSRNSRFFGGGPLFFPFSSNSRYSVWVSSPASHCLIPAAKLKLVNLAREQRGRGHQHSPVKEARS